MQLRVHRDHSLGTLYARITILREHRWQTSQRSSDIMTDIIARNAIVMNAVALKYIVIGIFMSLVKTFIVNISRARSVPRIVAQIPREISTLWNLK